MNRQSARAVDTAELEFTCAEGSDKGARSYQEDSLRVWRPTHSGGARPLLAVLADGMGGHVSGEVASSTACERYVENFRSGHGNAAQLLEHSLIASNDAISNKIRKNNALAGMGCTLVAGYFDKDGLRWVSVGDSSLLLYRSGVLTRMNADHSLGSFLDQQVSQGMMSAEEAKNDPRRRTLRSALIGSPIPLQDVEAEPHALHHGDWIIVASDGLETLSGDEIAHLIARHQHAQPKQMVGALLDDVKKRRQPHQDNVSIIAVKISDPHQAMTQQMAPSPSSQAHPITQPHTRTGAPMRIVGTTEPVEETAATQKIAQAAAPFVPQPLERSDTMRLVAMAAALTAAIIAGLYFALSGREPINGEQTSTTHQAVQPAGGPPPDGQSKPTTKAILPPEAKPPAPPPDGDSAAKPKDAVAPAGTVAPQDRLPAKETK